MPYIKPAEYLVLQAFSVTGYGSARFYNVQEA